ncbi:hypothetical protein [Acrocarpospora sp. B8E8]|uniref:hypothetical protein n=1 Tax=Acrocarpospora sp. B8E8 TaxID=3153572 RepID=UPI00325C4604
MPATHTPDQAVTYQGAHYLLHDGRIVLDWLERRPVLHHRKGCPLCCAVRVGALRRHPGDCGNCGPRYTGSRPDPCDYCGKTAHLHDDDGRPVHKACLEQVITAQALHDASLPALTLDGWRDAA